MLVNNTDSLFHFSRISLEGIILVLSVFLDPIFFYLQKAQLKKFYQN